MNRTYSPLVLGARVGPFTPLVGERFTVNPRAILNPNKTPMLVDQFRFSGWNSVGWGPLANIAALGVNIMLGSIPLTDGFVSLAGLAPKYLGTLIQAAVGGVPPMTTSPNGSITQQATQNIGDNVLVWHLPKPLLVPPNVQMTVEFQWLPTYPNDPGTGDAIPVLGFAMGARSLPESFVLPKTLDVPWVTETRCVQAVSRFVSGDSDLANATGVPLHVKSFVGQTCIPRRNGATGFPYRSTDITCQMTFSNNTALVRDPTPFGLLFPSDRGVLECDAVLQPGQFVRAEFEVPTGSTPTGAQGEDLTLDCTSVAMHGYRTLPMPGGIYP